jgi:serine phosphatase RsbU (regulator of sigma subunit)
MATWIAWPPPAPWSVLFERWQCETAETELAPGYTLVLYSDGVIEAERRDGEAFGEDGLVEALPCHGKLGATDLVRAIVEATLEFSGGGQQDDITLVVAPVPVGVV